jgi:hypothetical protein
VHAPERIEPETLNALALGGSVTEQHATEAIAERVRHVP